MCSFIPMRSGLRRPLIFIAFILMLILSVSYLFINDNLNQRQEPANSFDSFIARRELYAHAREREIQMKNVTLRDTPQQKKYSDTQLKNMSNQAEVELSVGFSVTRQNIKPAGTETLSTVLTDYFKNSISDDRSEQTKTSSSDLSRTNCSSVLLHDDVFIRNCLTGDVIGRLPDGMKTFPIKVPRSLALESRRVRQRSFEKVFETRAWGHGWDPQNTGLNASGMGATLAWTQELIGTLHVLIERIKRDRGVSRVRLLDVPCGDLAWMDRFLKTRDDVDYTGVDIVPAIIEHHQKTYRGQRSWKFEQRDILEEPFEEKFDVILCRTLLQHLYNYDVIRLLKQFSNSGSTYLLTSSFDRQSHNTELDINDDNPGRFRKLNLQVPPISLVPPQCVTRDGPPDAFEGWDHFIGLWKLPLRQVRSCRDSVKFKLTNTDVDIYSCTDWSLHEQ